MNRGGRSEGLERRAPGAPSSSRRRLLVAVVLSTLVTAAIAIPMAYQAYEARGRDDTPTVEEGPLVAVAGASVERSDIDDRLAFASVGAPRRDRPLSDATLRGAVIVFVDAPDVTEVRFRLDGGPPRRDDRRPFTLDAAPGDFAAVTDTSAMDDGPHNVVAELHFEGGRTTEWSATFYVDNP